MVTRRIQNESGYYHITARGNGKQIIFNEDADYLRYLDLLDKYNVCLNIEVQAYCLMSNHIHLLIYDPDFNMDKLFRIVHSLYSRYFNYKYERTGNLFQGRFGSKEINNDKQLMAALRYVLLNPEEAGFCKVREYKWSSYNLYGKRSNKINTQKLETYFKNFNEFESFINSKDFNTMYSAGDADEYILKHKLNKEFDLAISTSTISLSKKQRDEIILFLYKHGASYKQIVRLTGVSYGIVARVVNDHFKSQNRIKGRSKSNVDPGEIKREIVV